MMSFLIYSSQRMHANIGAVVTFLLGGSSGAFLIPLEPGKRRSRAHSIFHTKGLAVSWNIVSAFVSESSLAICVCSNGEASRMQDMHVAHLLVFSNYKWRFVRFNCSRWAVLSCAAST